jgi:hypothetical protein
MKRKQEQADPMCPFWHDLATDFLCVFPQRGYCVGGEHGKPRVPGRFTAQQYCAGDFRLCEGFQRRARQAP